MTARPNLVATPIVDRTGKHTTVYRKPGAAASTGPALPPPAVAAPTPAQPTRAEAYAERLAAVQADDAAWGPNHPKFHETLVWASEGIGSLTMAIARGLTEPAETLSRNLGDAFGDLNYSLPVMADVFGGLYFAFENIEAADIDLSDTEKLWDWQEDSSPDCGAYNAVFTVGVALQHLKLVSRAQVPDDMPTIDNQKPEERDMRFIIHLYAQAKEIIDYAEVTKNGDFIRLLDEFPERLDEISEGMVEGMHAAAIRARMDDEGHNALIDGTL